MRITVATPLFPPDTGAPASYVKELVTYLKNNEVSVVLYGTLPESVPGVTFYAIRKRSRLMVRLVKYTYTLYRVARETDIIYAQNGQSVELAAILASFFSRTPLILCISDPIAYTNRNRNIIHKIIHTLASKQAHTTIIVSNGTKNTIPMKPEILPFTPYPTKERVVYDEAWKKHISQLKLLFTYVS